MQILIETSVYYIKVSLSASCGILQKVINDLCIHAYIFFKVINCLGH